MDGPMPKTVLIILAAVVVLIVIVVRAGMRYLRADDDDFDDGAPAEHGRSRSRGNYPTGDQQARRRAHHGDEMPHERRTERVGAGRATRSSAGYGGERGPDRRGAVRSGQDRGWRDDSGEMPRSGERSLEPARPRQQRLVRSGPGGHPEISEPVAIGARSGRSKPGRGASLELDEFDSQPGRVGASTRIYERDAAGGRDRRDDRDRFGREEADIAGHRESRSSRDGRAGRDGRDSREPRDNRDSSDRIRARPAESDRELGDYDGRDRRGATRPNARADAHKNGARPDRGELLPAVKPRQGKGKRDSDGDWPTNEWDELSDVDYWAELASDKPLTTEGPSAHGSRAQGRESRQDRRPDADPHQRADADSDPAARQADRRDRKPDRALLPPAARKPEVAASDRPAAVDRFAAVDRPEGTDRFGTADPRAAGARPVPARHAAPRPPALMPAPADDDPLTSPSFPRVAADDSRSYRRTRAATSDGRQPASLESDIVQPTRNGGRAAARQAEPHPAYPAVPRVESVSGLEAASQTGSYPRAAAGLHHDGPFPASSSDPAGYQLPAANVARYEQATGGYSSPDSGTASYPAGSSYHEPGGYPPGPSAGAGAYAGDPAARGSYPGSEVPGYRAETGPGAYLAAVPDGYPAALSSPSYDGGGSYSLPAHTSGYDNGYPDHAAGYQGYTESSTSTGAHIRPEPGYQAGGYPGQAEPSFGASLAGGHGELSYPVYPAPMPADHGAAYQAPAPQLPGYQDAPYSADPHDPAAYPASVHETGAYGGADPYAEDPYGQPGYGGSGY
jgi:hypothetical protein